MRVGHEAHQRGWRGALGHIVQHVRDDWPAAIFVASLFAVLDHAVGWLDAINGHGFVAIGNAAGMPDARGDASVKAVVVQIDQTAAETRYLDRSPLDRCRLHEDLQAVYAAMKKHRSELLVVDLDLSPARWLLTDAGRETAEAKCQTDLYQTIKTAATSKPLVRTVLMTPIEAIDPVLRKAQEDWRVEMEIPKQGTRSAPAERPAVTFGHPRLPVKYGLVIKQYCHPDSLAGAAYTLAAMRIDTPQSNVRCTEPEYIDPRKYLSGVITVPLSAPPPTSKALQERLEDRLAADSARGAIGVHAVFFGAAFGQADTFVTPLGELYGVEIHAAGFLSFLDPVRPVTHLTELLIDIFYGFFFGFLIAHYWSTYFALRLSHDSDERLRAPFRLVRLGVIIAVATVGLTFLSWWLLARHGLWLSPIPMALGMLIESFVSGSVTQGIREADALKGQGRPPRVSFREGARKFFGGDIFLLARKGKKLSAALLGLRLGIWTAIVGGALVLALLP